MTELATTPGTGVSDGGQGGAPAVGGATGTTAPAGTWFDGFDDDAKGYVQNKGWKDPADLLGSYRNLEKLTGAGPDKLLKMPAPDDAQGWNDFYNRLGRPETPDAYKLPLPEGDSGEFAKVASSWFHEAGLTEKQAEAVASKWNEYMGQAQQQMEVQQREQYQQTVQQDNASLQQEWGSAYEQNIQVAKVAAREFGFDGPTIDKMEQALGFGGLMKLMHSIGSKVGEASFVSGESGGAGRFGVMAPAQAQAQIKALQGDAGFIKRYTAGDADAKSTMERLHKWAYPDA
jgi:hypothetical protein